MANDIKIGISLEGKDAISTIKSLEKGIKGLGDTGTKSIGSMTSAMQVFQGVVGAQVLLKSIELTGRALSQGAENALQFGKAVAEISSIAPRSAKETLALKNQLIGLSNEFAGDAQKQAKAFYNIVSAGVQGTAQQLKVLEVANKAAVAGLVDIDTSARVLVSSVNSYATSGLTAQEASDILFTTVKEGITTFGELSNSLGSVSPLASAAGVKFSELAGAISFITKSGVSTSESVTGLRAVLSGVIKPSVEAAKFAKGLGLQFDTAAIKSKGLAGFLKEVITTTGGTESALAKLFPNVQALGPIIQIAKGDFEDFERILGETAKASGATGAAFKVITDSAGFQFDKLQNQLKNLPTAFLTNFEEPIADALKAVNEFVGTNGILLVADAVDTLISVFQAFNATSSNIDQFFNFLASGVLEAGKAMTSTSSVIDQFFGFIQSGVLETSKAFSEFMLAINGVKQAIEGALGKDEAVANLKAQEEQIKNNIAVLEESIVANDKATVAIQDAEAKKLASIDKEIEANRQLNAERQKEEQKSFDISEEFRKKIAASREAQVASETQRKEEETARDEALAKKQLESALTAESAKFNAIQELKLSQKELEEEQKEEAKLAKQLENDENFQLLVDSLGQEEAARELFRISQIDGEKKRIDEINKLNIKADAEAEKRDKKAKEAQLNLDRITGNQKIGIANNTANLLNAVLGSGNKAAFVISKGAALAQVAVGRAQALAAVPAQTAAIPFPGNVAAAAQMSSLINLNSGLQAATIAATTIKGFQFGGVVDSPSKTGDSNLIRVNGDETVFTRRQSENLFNAVNQNNLGGGGGNITVNASSLDGTINQESIDSLIDQINDRIEFDNKTLRAS